MIVMPFEADAFEDVHRFCGDVGSVRVVIGRVFHGNAQIFQHSHAREGLGNLEAAYNAALRPFVRRQGGDIGPVKENASGFRA